MLIPNSPLKTYTGVYNSIRLDFTPEPLEPPERWSTVRANYHTRLAWLRIYLNGDDALPPDLIPSAYGFALFGGLLRALSMVGTGQSATAYWFSDPWQIDLSGDPSRDALVITVHLPNRFMALNQVEVPLGSFDQEAILLARKWLLYIYGVYPAEVNHPELGEEYRRFEKQLREAERTCK